jgi:hypothetical protein
MRRGEAEQRALEDQQRRLRLGGPVGLDDLAQRNAVDQFHDDRGALGPFDVFVQGSDLWIVYFGQNPRLGAEGRNELGVAYQVGRQVFDGDLHTGALVFRQHNAA